MEQRRFGTDFVAAHQAAHGGRRREQRQLTYDIAVDAAFGAVPAGGDLVGVAIHDADDVGLVAGEAALTHVRAATWK